MCLSAWTLHSIYLDWSFSRMNVNFTLKVMQQEVQNKLICLKYDEGMTGGIFYNTPHW